MMRARSTWLLVLVAVLAAAWGLYRLLELRFASGDVYPPYSSFRADPLGTRALFEGFELLADRHTTRLLETLNRLDSGRETTLFVFGVDSQLDRVDETEAKDLERFMQEGGRVVLTFFPETGKPFRFLRRARTSTNSPSFSPGPRRAQEPSGPSGSAPSQETETSSSTNSVVTSDPASTNAPPSRSPRRRDLRDLFEGTGSASLRERWGFDVEYLPLPLNEEDVAEPVTVQRTELAPALPAELDWHSAAFFTTTTQAWRAVYQRGENPVLLERAFGRGALVLASDSWFVSNEALRKDRHTPLLAWLAGPNRRLVFDETHLGVELKPGIATLARRYQLHGLFASLLLLAALFVWKNAVSFVPPYARTTGAAEIVSGRDSASGFVNLLRRSLAARDLLAVCLAEWKKSCGRGRRHRADRLLRLGDIAETRASTPVDGYREMSRIVSEKDL
jgi:hypothetical protein